MKKIILSPPFSNLRVFNLYKNVTRIVGSYTVYSRPGIYRVLSTMRKCNTGYTNNVGLRNPGIHKCKDLPYIVSISALEAGDWHLLLDVLETKENVLGVEFNVSCPNADVLGLNSEVIDRANSLFKYVIIKMPHLVTRKELVKYLSLGNFILHISNTRPSELGGISGTSLIDVNIEAIKYVKQYFPERKIIAGGGIYSLSDLYRYKAVGADYYSLSTILLSIFKTYKIIKGFYNEFK